MEKAPPKQSKIFRDRLRKSYSRLKPHRKGHATQLMNFYKDKGYLTVKQIDFARSLLAEMPTHKTTEINESEKLRKRTTKEEFEFFQKEYQEKGVVPEERNEGYSVFKDKMKDLLSDD